MTAHNSHPEDALNIAIMCCITSNQTTKLENVVNRNQLNWKYLSGEMLANFDLKTSRKSVRKIYMTPMQKACEVGNSDIVKYLLLKGIDSNGVFLDCNNMDHPSDCHKQNSVSQLGSEIENSDEKTEKQKNDESDTLTEALNFGLMLLPLKSIKLKEPLKITSAPIVIAVENKHASVVRLLLHHGADANTTILEPIKHSFVEVPILSRACMLSNRKIVELLLQFGANPNYIHTFEEPTTEYLPLITMIEKLPNLQALLENTRTKVFIDATGENNRTGFLIACWSGRKDLAEVLWKAGSDVTLVDDLGNTAVHLAAEGDHLKLVKFLVEEVRLNQNVKNKEGNMPSKVSPWKIKNNMFKGDCRPYLDMNRDQYFGKLVSFYKQGEKVNDLASFWLENSRKNCR